MSTWPIAGSAASVSTEACLVSRHSQNRHGHFRDSDLFPELFEMTVSRCIQESLVGGDDFAVDASLIKAGPTTQAAFATSRDGRISLPLGRLEISQL